MARDLEVIKIPTPLLRAMLHEAWKHGNDSMNIHTEQAGNDERFQYVDSVMEKRGFKKPE